MSPDDVSAAGGGPPAPVDPRGPWDELFTRYARLIYSVPLGYGLSRDDADDVFQSTCLVAVRKAASLPDAGGVVRWLASIASWESRRVLRRRTPEPRDPDAVALLRDRDAEVPRELLEDLEEQQALFDALATLKPRERALLEALFLAEAPLSYEQVADRLGVAVGSVGALRQRAMRRLRAELERRGF